MGLPQSMIWYQQQLSSGTPQVGIAFVISSKVHGMSVYHVVITPRLWFTAYWREAMIFASGEILEVKLNRETWMNFKTMLREEARGKGVEPGYLCL